MDDSLVSRRSKRSTAGNRMEAALAEMSIDDLMQDVGEDVDFVSKVDEEDMFESDFASTDEEGGEEEAGEKALEEEEKRVKRAVRQKAFKVPRAPVLKVTFDSPVPEDEDAGQKARLKPQRRVSLGQVIDAETGEVLEINKRQSTRESTRINTRELQSRLKHAEGRRASLIKRPKEAERRKTQAELITAALDMEEDNVKSHRDYLATEEERRKKARVIKPTTAGPKTRWRSRVEDVAVTVYEPAPPLYQSRPTWASPFAHPASSPAQPGTPYHNPYIVPPPGQPPATHIQQPFPASQYPFAYTPSKTTATSTSSAVSTSKQATQATPTAPPANTPTAPPATTPAVPPATTPTAPPATTPTVPPATTPTVPPATTPTAPPATTPAAPPTTAPIAPPTTTSTVPPTASPNAPSTTSPAAQPTIAPSYPNHYYQYPYYNPQAQSSHPQYQHYGPYYSYQPPTGQYTSQQSHSHLQLHPQGQIARKTTEKQAKNYVELLINDERPQEKPAWRETMNALFGEHVDWDNLRVYVGKNRPIARQIQTCPITGLQARYRDPRSGVPYANAGAFRILSRLLAHEYVWSPAGAPGGVGVFVGHEKQRGAVGMPDSWGEAMAGVGANWRKQRVEGKKDDKPKEKEKEVRVGERRSSRIAGEGGEAADKAPEAMDVDQTTEGEPLIKS